MSEGNQTTVATERRARPWRVAALVALLGLVSGTAWVVTRAPLERFCTLGGYEWRGGPDLPPPDSSEAVFEQWFTEGDGAQGAAAMAGGFSGSPSPSDGNTASQALVVPELDDFDREGERWVWTYATTDIEKLQVVISTGRDPATGSWIITGASNCGERRA